MRKNEQSEDRLTSLMQEIELLRKEMVKAADDYGRDHPTVLEYSKEIDRYHNLLMRYREELGKV
ncbi:aspartyl-phosphate phosphatase Spo0E family protein [Alteribacter aurantiacus]|uniref:aspartyl-phosphate phosphatase Spo0E family protein n=1 Tax=Alteribacter aurantiacus TaxID=254410 RepID=UPI00040FD8E0|nr:aspartyl-phosphate phosphatase Spo0E family protein [Alteribacter aurantiacus]